MRISYRPLVQVRLRHSYYADGRSIGDFAVEPTPATRERLRRAGLIFKPAGDGFAVFAEVVPGSEPPVPLRPLGDEPLRLAFLLNAISPCFGQMTELPQARPAASVLHFTNLRQDEDQGRLHLGDSVAGRRIGEGLRLAAGGLLDYRLAGAVGAELSLTDMFGNRLGPVPYTVAGVAPAGADLRVDLAAVPGITRGRYVLADGAQGSVALYYDPDLRGRRPFGIVELFSTTLGLAPAGQDLVPATYRFLAAQNLTPKEYVLQFERISTRWRYNVIKKYGTNAVELAKLTVAGPWSFSAALQADRAVFMSDEPIPLAERPHEIELKHNGTRIRKLPNPDIGTSIRKGEAAGRFVSEINVYV